jgi:hypothetical protein
MDYASCGQWLSLYTIVPGYNPGTAPAQVQTTWVQQRCDAKICKFFALEYGVIPGVTYGRLPTQLQSSWSWNRPVANGGPGDCNKLRGAIFN